jgi:hypothetical protein
VKKPWLAFLLNLLLAGAGLAYLGMWAWGVVNLIVAMAVGVVLALSVPASQLEWLEIVLPVVNGVMAQVLAQSHNAQLRVKRDRPLSARAAQEYSTGSR